MHRNCKNMESNLLNPSTFSRCWNELTFFLKGTKYIYMKSNRDVAVKDATASTEAILMPGTVYVRKTCRICIDLRYINNVHELEQNKASLKILRQSGAKRRKITFGPHFEAWFIRESSVQIRWLSKSKHLSFQHFRGNHNPCLVLNLAKSFLKTSKSLIFSTQLHRLLISSTLSPSQKTYEAKPSKDQKKQVCATPELDEKNYNHFTRGSHRGEHNWSTSRTKNMVTQIIIENFLCTVNPKSARNILTNLSPNSARLTTQL